MYGCANIISFKRDWNFFTYNAAFFIYGSCSIELPPKLYLSFETFPDMEALT